MGTACCLSWLASTSRVVDPSVALLDGAGTTSARPAFEHALLSQRRLTRHEDGGRRRVRARRSVILGIVAAIHAPAPRFEWAVRTRRYPLIVSRRQPSEGAER